MLLLLILSIELVLEHTHLIELILELDSLDQNLLSQEDVNVHRRLQDRIQSLTDSCAELDVNMAQLNLVQYLLEDETNLEVCI